MTNNELQDLKQCSEKILKYSQELIRERQSYISQGLYSETKLKDEKQLSIEKPNEYYMFIYLNVAIYPFYQKRTKTYCICCENWQPKPQKQNKDIKVYRGKYSIGSKDTLEEALITFQMLVNEFIKQKFDLEGALF